MASSRMMRAALWGDAGGGERPPTPLEFNVVPQVEGPLSAVLVGFPGGGEPGDQGSVEAVGMHQGVGKGAHLVFAEVVTPS